MNWCEHMKEGLDGLVYQGSLSNLIEIMFCPICGVSRPVEKELAEKLYEALWRRKIENSSWEELNPGTQDDWRKVASVAEEHFKGKP